MTLQEADKKLFKAALEVLSEHYTTIETEQGMIKDAIDELSDQFGMEKKTIRKIAKTYFKQTFNDERQDFESFETLYEQIVSLDSTN